MLPHGVLDHSFVSADDEGCLRHEEEEADRFERVDCRRGQAAIKVVDQDDELIDLCFLQQFAEFLPEMVNVFRNAFIHCRL